MQQLILSEFLKAKKPFWSSKKLSCQNASYFILIKWNCSLNFFAQNLKIMSTVPHEPNAPFYFTFSRFLHISLEMRNICCSRNFSSLDILRLVGAWLLTALSWEIKKHVLYVSISMILMIPRNVELSMHRMYLYNECQCTFAITLISRIFL